MRGMNRPLLPDRHRARPPHPRPRRLRHRSGAGAPRADRAREPEGQRDRHAHRRARARRRAREGRRAGARRRARTALRPADRAQGPLRDARHPHDVRVADLSATTCPTSTRSSSSGRSAAGAITLGKSNTPEFGAGSQTFNEVFGRTLNPYDPTKTCGGSSGGAAVALACGMVPIADGSDLGGSLRNPASFCNVVGLRPSLNRVPVWPAEAPWLGLSTHGPMARTVEDVALLLSVMAGPDRRAPLAIAEPASAFGRRSRATSAACGSRGRRTSAACPSTPASRRDRRDSARSSTDLGCAVDDGHPDFTDAREIFQVWRAVAFLAKYGAAPRAAPPPDEGHRDLEHRAGREAHRRARSRRRSRGARPSTTASARSWRSGRSCVLPVDAGPALRRHAALRHRDQRRAAARPTSTGCASARTSR